ncbi:MAG TPA: ATP-binding protein, partial [Actinomycetota bacterium]|nr:ATP-binding protein [Actinomycetota bacterium]
ILGALIGDERPVDDVAVMLVKRDPRPSTALEFAVEARARSLVVIRRALSRWLDDLEIPRATALEIVTAVSEAAANAVEHAYGPAGGQLAVAAERSSDALEVLVRDQGRWRGASRGDRGHGLRLIRSLMDEVHVDASDGGTVVRMRRRLTP